jgi:single-strand DNA-binding protein
VAGEYLKKGSSVYIEGRIQYDSWDDKATGEKKYMTRIRGDQMKMLGSKNSSGGDASFEGGGERASAPSRTAAVSPSAAPKKPAKMDDFDDDIPF